jgi:HlyD family secretion protein
LLALFAVLLAFSYLRQTPLKVRVATVQRGPIRSVVSTNGKIEPLQNLNFEAHAPVSTTVKQLLVKEGDHVRKGQLLAQLDDFDIRSQAAKAQAQIKSAQANQSTISTGGTQEEVITLNAQIEKAQSDRETAQRNLDALRRLQQQGAASPGEVTTAEAKLQSVQADLTMLQQKKKERYSQPEVAKIQAQGEEAQAAYQAAEDSLHKSSVRAPFDGVVYSVPVKQGDFVQAGTLLLQVADLSHVIVRAFVDEPDVGRLQKGQHVDITWDALPGRAWSGEVNTVPATVKPRESRNVGETTCVIDNHDFRLLPNINVGVTIIVAVHDNVLTLQRDAIHSDENKPYVFQLTDDHLKVQPVQISLQNLTRVEVTSGLSEGAKVALPAEESKPLVDGSLVKVVP